MAYSSNSMVTVSDYNTLAGVTGSAAGSSGAATAVAGYLWGVGFGDRGYGQSAPALITKPANKSVSSTDWTSLRTIMSNMASYQGSSISFSQSTPSAALMISADTSLSSDLTTLDTNRLNTNSGASLSVTAGSLTITRASTWGSGNTNIICEATAAFASEDAARFFFNSGGGINLVLAHPNTTTTQNSNWNTILTALGTIGIQARSTVRSGSGGTPQSIGYYNLTAAYQTVFNGTNIGTGAYTSNSVLVEALVSSVTGTNGGNGTTVKIRVTLTDGHTNAFSDLVASGTNAAFGFKKAATVLSGIASPTFTNITNF